MGKITKYILVIVIMISSQLMSQTSGGLKLSLEDCLKIASEENFDIRLIEYQMDASKANLNSAFGRYLPGINFNSGYNIQNFQLQSFTNPGEYEFVQNRVYNMGVNANYTIFDGFNREASYKQAENNLNTTILNSEQTKSDISSQIFRNYITSIQNIQILNVRNENLNVGIKDLERLKAQYDAGAIPISDVYTQEAEVARRELNLLQAENDLQISKANLLSILGMDPTTNVELDINSFPQELDDEEILDFRKEVGSIETAVSKSMKQRSDLQASHYQKEFSESQVDIAYSSYYPSLSLSSGWNWNNTQFGDFQRNGRFTFGLNLQVPLFDRFQTNNQVQSSQLQFEQANTQYDKLVQTIKTSVKTAYLNLESAEKQIYIAKKSVKAANLSYMSQKERYELGASNINNVITANANLTSARIDLINAVYLLIQAQKEIEYQTGLLELN
ncbi:TolC family protein [Candidatus Kapabacteria bacterium]|nr:TolC family protein [Candidatus Kapabacteria bacterium]